MTRKITEEISISEKQLEQAKKNIKSVPDFKPAIKKKLKGKTTDLMQIILAGGISLNASDIHIEPLEKRAKMRVRVDGILHDVLFLPLPNYKSVLSRIKLLAGAKLNVSDRPQDGRFSITVGDFEVEVRVSIIPAEHGESIVLRVLNPQSLIDLGELGVRENLLQDFKNQIKKPNGMILVTGPTGSGKTTTLYAFLRQIRSPKKKIITIENPIEYHLEGISQTQTEKDKGYDFASGLESIVRQDPDVILVGEIRNKETAKIALQASLTGHLVFSTVHTNDAAGTITRLHSLGADIVNIAPALRMVIAQRLVREACDKCMEFRKPTSKELDKLKKALNNLPDEVEKPEINESTEIPDVHGCKYCNNTGYRGRTAIFEAFTVDEEIEELILNEPSISELRKKIQEKGMVTMKQDGFLKVLKGQTTIKEVERITG
ncbi:MAG: GspE/PulE family protein [Candidatus Paceibacterota bacterium]